MKISMIRSYRSHKNYKFTPLFWKLSVSTIVLSGIIGSAIAFDLPVPSVSVASASDIEAAQVHDLNMNSSSSPETHSTANGNGEMPVSTDASIGTSTSSNPTQAGIVAPSTDPGSNSPASSSQPNTIKTTPPVDGLFSQTAFVGDSRTEGLLLYSGVKGATDYAIKGLNLKSVLSNAFVTSASGSKVTILTDMKNRSFDKIYISFGLNELGWNSDTFAKKYSELVNKVRDIQPNAAIYLQATFPINPDKCRFDQNTNKHIQEMNSQIEAIASSMPNVHYVDLFAQFQDSRGYLPSEASSDGIHLNKKYCVFWLNCLEENLAGKTLPVQGESETSDDSDTIPPATSKTVGSEELSPAESTPMNSISTESATQVSDETKNE